MERQNRAGIIALIVVGFVLVLCVGMVIGGAAVYGVLRIGSAVTSQNELEAPTVLMEEFLPLDEEGAWSLDELPMPGVFGGAAVMVMSVAEGSPAADAGLQHGDLIASLDGDPIDSASALTDAIASHEPGDWVTLGVLQGSDEVELQVRLGEHPDQAGKAYLGVTIRDLVRHLRFHQRPGGVEELPAPPLP